MEVKGQTWCSRAGRVAWGFQDLDLPYRPSLPGHPAPQGHGHRILTQNEQDGRNKEKKALLCREVRWSPGPAWAGGVCPRCWHSHPLSHGWHAATRSHSAWGLWAPRVVRNQGGGALGDLVSSPGRGPHDRPSLTMMTLLISLSLPCTIMGPRMSLSKWGRHFPVLLSLAPGTQHRPAQKRCSVDGGE